MLSPRDDQLVLVVGRVAGPHDLEPLRLEDEARDALADRAKAAVDDPQPLQRSTSMAATSSSGSAARITVDWIGSSVVKFFPADSSRATIAPHIGGWRPWSGWNSPDC